MLRDAAGLVVDSLNYGLMVEPWAAEGYHAVSGTGESGCHVSALGQIGPGTSGAVVARSAGRFPDGADTDSNCSDFLLRAATTMPIAATAGMTNIKVASVAG